MLRKLIAGSIIGAALFCSTAANADMYDRNDPCFSSSGCWWDEIGGVWVCPAYVYQQCAPG